MHTLAPGVIHHLSNGATCGKFNIFHRPEEATLFVIVNACLCSKMSCSLEPLRTLFFIYMDLNKMRKLNLYKDSFYSKLASGKALTGLPHL